MLRHYLSVFLLVLLCIGTGQPTKALDSISVAALERELDLAESAHREGRIDDALRMFLSMKEREADFEGYPGSHWRLESGFSNALAEAQAMNLALVEAKKALTLSKKINQNPDVHRISIGRVGAYYLRINELDSALVYFRNELNWARAQVRPRPIMNAGASNNLGMVYTEMEEPDSAWHYFNLAVSHLVQAGKPDMDLRAAVQDNIATLLTNTQQYDKAYNAYLQNLDLALSNNNLRREMQARLGIIQVSQKLDKIGIVKKELKIVSSLLPRLSWKNRMSFQRTIFDLWIAYTERIKDWPANSRYQRKASRMSDSLSRQNRILLSESLEKLAYLKLARISQDLEVQQLLTERQQEKLEHSEREVRFRALLLVVLIITGLLLLVGVWGYFRRRALTQKKQRELLEVQNELASTKLRNRELESARLSNELESKKKDLGDLAIYLANLRELHDHLVERLQKIRQEPADEQPEKIKALIAELASRTRVDQKTSFIQENITQVNQEFYEKLHQGFPGLTKSETELCGLLRLQLANKEIAALRNVSPNSVKMSRYRLRKKLLLQPEENIYSFLQKF